MRNFTVKSPQPSAVGDLQEEVAVLQWCKDTLSLIPKLPPGNRRDELEHKVLNVLGASNPENGYTALVLKIELLQSQVKKLEAEITRYKEQAVLASKPVPVYHVWSFSSEHEHLLMEWESIPWFSLGRQILVARKYIVEFDKLLRAKPKSSSDDNDASNAPKVVIDQKNVRHVPEPGGTPNGDTPHKHE